MTPEQLQVIRDYVNAAIAADPVNWVNTVTQRMDEVGVSPAMLQQAFPDLSVAQVQTAYNQARPTGAFATPAQSITVGGPTTPQNLQINAPAIQPTPVTPAPVTPVSSTPSILPTPSSPTDLAPVPTPVVTPTAPVPGGPASPLPAAPGTSQIDPIIAPYLSEALGTARSLFLTGQQPQLYPGQMFVSPSAETLSALEQQTGLAEAAQPFFQQAAAGLDIGQRGLQQTALGGFLSGSPYRDAMIGAATRPLTQQFTEQVMPGIQSQFSQAGRLGSGAQAAVTGRATEGFTRALGDVTSQIAAQDYARERGFQEAAFRDVMQPSSQIGNIFSQFLAPSQALAGVGAQREAIAGQPLQEAIQRFDYAQNLPQQQFANYMASIYGSPLGNVTQRQPAQTNQLGQVLGGGILGSQLGSLFGGFGGYTGGQVGAGLGALGGLLL